jgi:hypothetical protein
MSQIFAGSIPTKSQIEKLRLILSTYQDGLGQLVFEPDKSLPGWRDFERSVAFVFGGIAQESKAIFDVLVPIPHTPKINYGISCKMRETLQTVERTRRVTVEVSNSSGKFWDALRGRGIDDYRITSHIAGKVLIDLVESWHNEASLEKGGIVDLTKSFYLLLQWHKRSGRYQLFQFPVQLPTPETLSWEVDGRRLIGRDDEGVIIEWYGYSGGQLKYYPFADKAIWSSEVFQLEPLPKSELGYGLKRRVIDFFAELWQAANEL